MDANQLPFHMLESSRDWSFEALVGGCGYDETCRSVALVSARPFSATEDPARAGELLDAVPVAADGLGAWLEWDAEQGQVVVHRRDGSTAVFYEPEAGDCTDLAVTREGLVAMAIGGDLVLCRTSDLPLVATAGGDGADPRVVSLESFSVWRIAHAGERLAVLDRTGQVAVLEGTLWPLDVVLRTDEASLVAEPLQPDPPRLRRLDASALDATTVVAIAGSDAGRLVIVGHRGQATVVHEVGAASVEPHRVLSGIEAGFSARFVEAHQLAVRVTGTDDVAVYDLALAGSPVPVSAARYPLQDAPEAPFGHAPTTPRVYRSGDAIRPLLSLSYRRQASYGRAAAARPLDGHRDDTTWHRLFIEGHFPRGTGATVWLAASDDPVAPADERRWYPHLVGSHDWLESTPEAGWWFASLHADPVWVDRHRDAWPAPRASWIDADSEVPLHPGLLGRPRERDRSGVFSVLVQRSGRSVSALRGRFLHVRMELHGLGHAAPRVRALRIYAHRFSYVENYLPELYHETSWGPDADVAVERSTGSDFLERFLGNLEGVFTRIEGVIAHAHTVTSPSSAPVEALPWLASWIGFTLRQGLPESRQRAMLDHAIELARWRGTRRGLELAIDLATGGAASAGAAVVLEGFQLRRTLATILGADLSGADNPLTAEIARSGNSFVGDTLILGSDAVEARAEFLALFDDLLPRDAREEDAIERLYETLAFRVTVLVAPSVPDDQQSAIRALVGELLPAHVVGAVESASQALIVGLRSLVGVDTFLGAAPPRRGVTLGRTRLGEPWFVQRPHSVDTRLEGEAHDPS